MWYDTREFTDLSHPPGRKPGKSGIECIDLCRDENAGHRDVVWKIAQQVKRTHTQAGHAFRNRSVEARWHDSFDDYLITSAYDVRRSSKTVLAKVTLRLRLFFDPRAALVDSRWDPNGPTSKTDCRKPSVPSVDVFDRPRVRHSFSMFAVKPKTLGRDKNEKRFRVCESGDTCAVIAISLATGRTAQTYEWGTF